MLAIPSSVIGQIVTIVDIKGIFSRSCNRWSSLVNA